MNIQTFNRLRGILHAADIPATDRVVTVCFNLTLIRPDSTIGHSKRLVWRFLRGLGHYPDVELVDRFVAVAQPTACRAARLFGESSIEQEGIRQ